jgi:hypothetical protein
VDAIARLPKREKAPKPNDPAMKLSEAQRAVQSAEAVQLAAAQALIAVWQSFDAALDASPELIGTPLTLGALTLNDVPLSHALWFEAHPDSPSLPSRIRDEPDLAARLGMAPIRIAWVRRYLKTLSPEVQQLVGQQESARFERNETETLEFEKAYVAYRMAGGSAADAAAQTRLRDAAAIAAGKLDLYTQEADRQLGAFGLFLVERGAPASPDTTKAIAAAYTGTRLRLL